METAYISAFAALAGSVIGGLTSLGASWLTHRVQFRAQQLAHDISRREELYKDFIEEASQCYADAFERNEPDVSKLVCLYALVSRMRVWSSVRVIEEADKVMRSIIDTYVAPNKTFKEVIQKSVIPNQTAQQVAEMQAGHLDPLRDFSETCRDELRAGVVVARLP